MPSLVFAPGAASPGGRVELDRGEGVAQLVGVVAASGRVAQAKPARGVVPPALDAAVVEPRASVTAAGGQGGGRLARAQVDLRQSIAKLPRPVAAMGRVAQAELARVVTPPST
jgi:hypothetical protein